MRSRFLRSFWRMQESVLMARLRPLFYWMTAISAYWLFALWLLVLVSPVSVDGSGPTVTFFSGIHPPTPTLQEYRQSIGTRLQFLYPYWIAASLITLLGCGLTPWLLRRWRPKPSHVFLVSSAFTLFSLLTAGAISDVGIALHIWRGPTMYGGISYVMPFLKFMVPMSLFAGLLAFTRNRRNA
jgi:hypothetical protein